MARAGFWISALSVIVASLALAPAALAQTHVPGTRVALKPPDGFTPSQRFTGFEHAAQRSSIMVTEMPAGFAELRAAFTTEGLATRGMKLIESRDVDVDGVSALLVHVSQSAAGGEFLKWMLLARNGRESVLVVGTFPRTAAASLSAPVRSAVLSASLKAGDKVDVMEGLPFGVDAGVRLKIARRMGNTLVMTRSGTMAPGAPGDPLFVVGMSFSGGAMGDLQRFSEQHARQTAEVSNLRSLSGRRLQVDGLEAYEILADASDLRSGLPLRFYQVIASDDAGYFVFKGLVGWDGAAEYLAEFRRVTESFRRLVFAERGAKNLIR